MMCRRDFLRNVPERTRMQEGAEVLFVTEAAVEVDEEAAEAAEAACGVLTATARSLEVSDLSEGEEAGPSEEAEVETPEEQVRPSIPEVQGQVRPDVPVGARLGSFWAVWEKLGVDPSIVSMLKFGVTLEFGDKPFLTTNPKSFPLSDPVKRQAVKDQVKILLEKNVIEVVEKVYSPGFYSRLFVVPKKEPGVWRAILDLSVLNTFMIKEHFKMESMESIRAQLEVGCWVTSIDLSDAYYHIGIHPSYRKYLRFVVDDIVYQFLALVMGLTSSPRKFTKTASCLKAIAHMYKIRLFQYLDDWIIVARTREEAALHTAQVVNLAQVMGFVINWKKSELKPTQDMVFLGYHYLLGEGMVKPSQKNWGKLQGILPVFLSHTEVQARLWQTLIGLLVSMEKLVPLGMMHVRAIQFALKQQWSQFRGNPGDIIHISPEVKKEIAWWSSEREVMIGVPLKVDWDYQTQKQLFTDASTMGWGGHVDNLVVSGIWTEQESTMHINLLEMLAVWNSMRQLIKVLAGKQVMISTDNVTTVFYLRKQGGTKSKQLNDLAADIIQWMVSHGIQFKCKHVPGKLNVIADQLSRAGQILPTEWSLHPQLLERLWGVWEKPLVDLFATKHNKKLSLYVSPVPDPMAMAVDALSIDWTGMWGYAYPPTSILSQVLQKIQQEDCVIILVAPLWKKQMWYPLLLDLLVDLPMELPVGPRMLKQPQSMKFHTQPEVYNLHAFRLSRIPSERRDFLKELQKGCPKHKSRPPGQCTSLNGTYSVVGVLNRTPIHCRLLSR